MNICIIPARAGSKRIKNKNILPFIDKPIISYVINAAIETNLFDEIMVSTESEEIANIAKSHGANIPFLRSKKNADDYATTSDVILEVIEKYAELGITFDSIFCLYPTSVLIKPKLILNAFEKFKSNSVDSLITVQKFKHPIERAIKVTNQKAEWINKEFEFSRTQDFENTYYDSGQFYILKTSSFIIQKSLLMENTFSLILDEKNTQDVDIYSDLYFLEYKYKNLKTI